MSGGLVIPAYTDEMITPRLAEEMRRRGYDILSCHGAGRANQNISDEDQLTFATNAGRAIYTFNWRDFLDLHQRWRAAGRTHAGILVSVDLNSDRGEMARRLQQHLDTVAPAHQRNAIWILFPSGSYAYPF